MLWCVGLLGFFYVAYVAAVWSALRFGFFDWLTRDTVDAKAHFDAGYSLWPGSFHLRGAIIRYLDYNIEVEVRARSATLELALLPLFSRSIIIESFVAQGGSYRMTHRVHDASSNRQRLAAFPDTGFHRPRVYDRPKPPYAPPPFHLIVKSINAEVDEAWILEYRVPGPLHARGGFDLSAEVSVFPSEVTFAEREIFVGERRLAARAGCTLSATVRPFPGDTSDFGVIVEKISGRADCRLEGVDPTPLSVYWPDLPLLLEGRGTLGLNLQLEAGRLLSSQFSGHLDMSKLGVGAAHLGGETTFSVEADTEGTMDALLSWRDDGASVIRLGKAFAEANLEQPTILIAPRLREFHMSTRDLELPSTRALQEVLPWPRELAGRASEVTLDVDYRATARPQEAPDAKAVSPVAPPDLAPTGPDREEPAEAAPETEVLRAEFAGVLEQPAKQLACRARTRAACERSGETGQCQNLLLECEPLNVGTTVTWPIRLQSSHFAWSNAGLESDWVVVGGNPRAALKAALEPDFWGRLGLDLAPLGDLQGRLSLNHKNGTWAATLPNFQSGVLAGRGSVIFAETLVSRWNIATPLGRFGIAQTPVGVTIAPFVSAEWDVLAYPTTSPSSQPDG